MINRLQGGAAALCLAIAFAPAAIAETYTRKGDQAIEVAVKGDKLFCTRVSDGYEMCNGMREQQDGTWKGKKMKHPDMPRWMSFNGTVTFGASSLKIRGCAVGICDSETWSKK